MKFLFHNDKSTIKDELFLLMFIVFRGSSIACAQTIQKQRRNNLLG